MIRPIDIRLNAAHPELPLAEAVTFTGAPSTVLIRGVPPNCGRWAITAVSVAATYPDGSTTTRAAVQSANGVWVATLPATATSGRTANGLRVMADGIDENGVAVTGYILGVADFAVASLGVTPAPEPGETSWQMLYFDAVPGTLRKGDVAKVDGVLKLYNGTAWEAFATPPTFDDAVTRTSANGVKSSGIWSAIWGALAALPTGVSSLYDWCVAQLAGKASKSDVDPLLFAQYYPEGNVKSAAEFTPGIKYTFDSQNRTASVKTFCNTGDSENDNSPLVGRVVIPPFVDARGNPYISDDGTRYRVVGVSNGTLNDANTSLTAIVAPNTVTNIGASAFRICTALTSISLPAATTLGSSAFHSCTSLTSVDFGDMPRSDVPSGSNAFNGVPTTCRIIVPYMQYDAWIAADGWKDLPQEFVRHSEKADKPTTFTAGNLAKFDNDGNPTDSGKKPSDFQSALSAQQLANIAAVSDALAFDATHSYAAGDPVVYDGTLYTFTSAHTGAWTGSDVSAVDIIARLAGKLDKSGGTMTGSLHMGYNYLKWQDGNLIYWLSADGLYIWNDGDDVTHSPNYIIEFPLASGTLALTADIPYNLVTKTIDNGAVTLDDRAINAVAVSATLSPNTLTINFPTAATSDKVRDFAMRLNIAAGVTAPEIAWPQGVTLENNDGEVPEIADGGTGGSSTILYFSETENNETTAKFLVKGETLTAIAQA